MDRADLASVHAPGCGWKADVHAAKHASTARARSMCDAEKEKEAKCAWSALYVSTRACSCAAPPDHSAALTHPADHSNTKNERITSKQAR